MNQEPPQGEAQQEYDQKHAHPLGATLIIVVCVFAIGLLLFCFIRYRTTFFGVLGLGLMTVGTGIETRRVYVVFRTPRLASLARVIIFFLMTLAGELAYVITSSVERLWNSVTISAVGVQSLHLCLSSFAISHLIRIPEFDPNHRAEPPVEPTHSDIPLAPEAEAFIVESNSSESEEKKAVTGFVSPYGNDGAAVTPSASPYEMSDGPAIGNLPVKEAVAFPEHAIAEWNEA